MRGIKTILIFISIPAFAAWTPYTVQKGDTLGSLAKRSLPSRPIWGEGGSVAYLFNKNRSVIENPNVIYVGQEILIPEGEETLTVGEASIANKSEGREPATENDEPVAVQAEEPQAHPQEIAPVSLSPEIEDRRATLKVGLLSSLWDRSLKDKTTSASGTARSNAILGLSLESLFPVSKSWNAAVGISYRSIKFANAPNRTISADQANFVRFRIGASRSSENYELGGGFQYEQLPLVIGVSSSAVGITSFNVFSPYLSGTWKFHKFGKTSVGLGALLTYSFASSNEPYKLESGWLGEISLPLSRAVSESFSYGLTPFLEYGARETNTVEHTETNGGVKADFIWRY